MPDPATGGTPQRIQRKRAKGWRMPAGAVYVGRPSRWGNWYVVGQFDKLRPGYDVSDAWLVYTVNKWGHRSGSYWAGFDDKLAATTFAVELYRRALEATYLDLDGALNRSFYVRGLEGKDLACWCPLEDEHGNRWPCHADVLLSLANETVDV